MDAYRISKYLRKTSEYLNDFFSSCSISIESDIDDVRFILYPRKWMFEFQFPSIIIKFYYVFVYLRIFCFRIECRIQYSIRFCCCIWGVCRISSNVFLKFVFHVTISPTPPDVARANSIRDEFTVDFQENGFNGKICIWLACSVEHKRIRCKCANVGN